VDEFLLATPAAEHAHNSLICAIVFNVGRDTPEPGPAVWVSAASDKTVGPTTAKPVITSDAGEQRLKREVMAVPPRDRRRFKAAAPDENAQLQRPSASEEYYYYLGGKIKAPDAVPASAGGLTKTNWDLEIKKGYGMPLSVETQEFPDTNSIFARMVPKCYEESLAGGTNQQCAELVQISAEIFFKDFLSQAYNRTRSNGPTYENSAGGGMLTSAYKKELIREEAQVKAGKLQRTIEDGLLPIEAKEAYARRPLGLADIQLASRVAPTLWNGKRHIGWQVNEATLEYEQDEFRAERAMLQATTNGDVTDGEDAMDVDDDDYGWEGTAHDEQEALGSLLADCLTAAGP